LERADKLRAETAQLFPVAGREALEDFFTGGRQAHAHPATVGGIGHAAELAASGEAIHEAHGAVMAHVHDVGQFTDGQQGAARRSLEGEEGLILLLGDAGRPRGFGAEMQKTPQGMAVGRQRAVISGT
jgi:hypothetical protein